MELAGNLALGFERRLLGPEPRLLLRRRGARHADRRAARHRPAHHDRLLFPITFYLPPLPALIMLAGIYYGAQYGGAITSILLNLPGETASAVTCLDGYPMARQGRGGTALAVSALGSFLRRLHRDAAHRARRPAARRMGARVRRRPSTSRSC